ncbi:peptide ABC transporter permease [Desulfotomaculum copahuensis]|uniref:Peptide ABC transporter permease n=2 Tax=Desulfotomaculum copahuensis TaxID=1838280 RepID=A0A1B7LEZ4_9FIRM|nr:peptide ABC transporter permease [Desulfotomaculum copahuensis]
MPARQYGLWYDAWRRLRQNKIAIAGAVIVLALILAALLAPVLAPHNPLSGNIIDRLQAPSAAHWFGTDSQGRDVLSRIIYGSRISIQVGVISVGIALLIGTLIGAAGGYYGGWVDNVLMRVVDIMLAFPSILLAIAITAMLGPELKNAMIAIGVVNIPFYARIVRSTVLSVKETEYVEAARAIGGNDLRIIFRHVLPNCMAPVIVQTTMGIGTAILDAAGLSFLGLGAQPPTPEWGAMLSDGRSVMQQAPWMMFYPGLAIMLVVLGFNLLGDGLRDALDPRLKQ